MADQPPADAAAASAKPPAPPLLRAKQFVWSMFPYSQDPLLPGKKPHQALVLVVGAFQKGGRSIPGAVVAYTSSQTSDYKKAGRLPRGVFLYPKEQAEAWGQRREIILDLRVTANLPLDKLWFHQIEEEKRGVVGQATWLKCC